MGINTLAPAAALDVNGNVFMRSGLYSAQPITIAANYTINGTESRIYCNNTSTITLSFPDVVVASGYVGRTKLINTGTVILTGVAGQLFDGSPSYILNGKYNAYEIHSNGAGWYLW